MHLNSSCLQAIAQCMGGEYFIGNLRATCYDISRTLPGAPDKYESSFDLIQQCCRVGNIPVLDKLPFNLKQTWGFTTIYYWASYYATWSILEWALHNEVRYGYNNPYDILHGAARSGRVDIYDRATEFHKKFVVRHNGDYEGWHGMFFEVGFGGSMQIYSKVLEIANPYCCYYDYVLIGAIQGNQLDFYRCFLDNYPESRNFIVNSLNSTMDLDPLEYFVLAEKYVDLTDYMEALQKKAMSEGCNKILQHYYNSRAYVSEHSSIIW